MERDRSHFGRPMSRARRGMTAFVLVLSLMSSLLLVGQFAQSILDVDIVSEACCQACETQVATGKFAARPKSVSFLARRIRRSVAARHEHFAVKSEPTRSRVDDVWPLRL
jgi:hypothetical protein